MVANTTSSAYLSYHPLGLQPAAVHVVAVETAAHAAVTTAAANGSSGEAPINPLYEQNVNSFYE